MLLLDVAVGIFAALTLLVQGVAIWLAYQMPRVEIAATAPSGAGATVRVVIAARNEEEAIGPCLDALLAQRYGPLEVVVVDGGSTDGTVAEAARRPGVRVVAEPPLPPGWVGKNWACSQGARDADAAYLLFLDADVRLAPDAVGSAVAWAERDRADLVTFAPRIETVGFWERVVLPFYTQMVLTYFRAPRVNRPGSRAAMANGQFCLVRRTAYEAVGGHAAIAPFVLEDVALARRFRSAGRPMRVGWTPELAETRMYRDRAEMFEGLLKNVHDTEFRLGRQLAFLAGLVGFFLLPLAVLPLGVALADPFVAAVGLLLVAALFGKHAAFARAVGGRARDGLLYPVAVGFYLVLLARSISDGLRGRPLEWKGRTYARDPGPSLPPNP